MSPGDCWVWPARGYAGEADVATFVDGDVRRDLSDFWRDCNDTERGIKMQPILLHSSLKVWGKEADFPSSLHLNQLCSSPLVSYDLKGTHRGKKGVEKIGLKWEESVARGNSVILGRPETASPQHLHGV